MRPQRRRRKRVQRTRTGRIPRVGNALVGNGDRRQHDGGPVSRCRGTRFFGGYPAWRHGVRVDRDS